MSHDTDNNPAELVGVDGTICYRKGGGSCVELGGGESLWELGMIDGVVSINPVSWQHVVLEDVWIKDAGINEDSNITIRLARGGGGGGHDDESVEEV